MNVHSPHYAISRIQAKPGIWCWLVAFRRRGTHYYKAFYDVRRGGPEKSLAAAIAWRDEQLAKVVALGKRDFCQLRRTTNTSGVAGVVFIRPASQPEGNWQARLRLPDNRIISKTFSVKAYGEREAFRLAVAARQELLTHVADEPFLHHPLAKAFCARQSAAGGGVADKHQKPPGRKP
ncbi:MAG: AP2 domain-containing protein [Rhodocyclaceae bacterium]